MKVHISKEWLQSRAHLEEGMEIGAGAGVIARCPRCGEPVERGQCTNRTRCSYLLPEARRLNTQTPDTKGQPQATGHTLLELLLVIAIIGILAALTAPTILRTFKAKRTELLRLERALNARIEFFSRTETATGELTDPRLRQIYDRYERIYLGGLP